MVVGTAKVLSTNKCLFFRDVSESAMWVKFLLNQKRPLVIQGCLITATISADNLVRERNGISWPKRLNDKLKKNKQVCQIIYICRGGDENLYNGAFLFTH